jgi:hypothetical protein
LFHVLVQACSVFDGLEVVLTVMVAGVFLFLGLFHVSFVGHGSAVHLWRWFCFWFTRLGGDSGRSVMEATSGVVVAPVLRWVGGGGDEFGLVGDGCIVFVSNTKQAGVGVWLLLEEGLTVVSVFFLAVLVGILVLGGVCSMQFQVRWWLGFVLFLPRICSRLLVCWRRVEKTNVRRKD